MTLTPSEPRDSTTMGNVFHKVTDSVASYRRKLQNATSLRHGKPKAAKKLDPRIDTTPGG